jgi:hypothetical protein
VAQRGCESAALTTYAAEQERADVRAAREAWFEAQPEFDPDRLVFLDAVAHSPLVRRAAVTVVVL